MNGMQGMHAKLRKKQLAQASFYGANAGASTGAVGGNSRPPTANGEDVSLYSGTSNSFGNGNSSAQAVSHYQNNAGHGHGGFGGNNSAGSGLFKSSDVLSRNNAGQTGHAQRVNATGVQQSAHSMASSNTKAYFNSPSGGHGGGGSMQSSQGPARKKFGLSSGALHK